MTPTKTRPHKPMLAEWTSEISSLSHAGIVKPISYAVALQAKTCIGMVTLDLCLSGESCWRCRQDEASST